MSLIYIGVYVLVLLGLYISSLLISPPMNSTLNIEHSAFSNKLKWICTFGIGVGVVASLYVFFVAGQLSESGMPLTSDPFVLIMYQFSDLLIAFLLFMSTQKNNQKLFWLGIALFVFYCIFTGLRYKLVLLLGPLIIYFYFMPRNRLMLVRFAIFLGGLLILVLFTIMTISRSKFSGLDFSAFDGFDKDMFLYGLFAETNSIFGLASCIEIFGKYVPFAGLSPVTDAFVQFIPRFLYPDKNLYVHLKDVAWGIAYSEQSLLSGTTLPFFGEYYAAFGVAGVLIGVILYVFFTVYMLYLVTRWATTYPEYLIGVGLVCVFMGYYYYSRGAFSQIFKGFVFVVLPYLWLLRVKWRMSQ